MESQFLNTAEPENELQNAIDPKESTGYLIYQTKVQQIVERNSVTIGNDYMNDLQKATNIINDALHENKVKAGTKEGAKQIEDLEKKVLSTMLAAQNKAINAMRALYEQTQDKFSKIKQENFKLYKK